MRSCKVVVIGGQGSGKTSLITRYLYGRMPTEAASTVGMSFASKRIALPSADAAASNSSTTAMTTVQLWDTPASTPVTRPLFPTYLAGANVVILTFSLLSSSLDELRVWCQHLAASGTSTPPSVVVVCGTMLDLFDAISPKDLKTIAVAEAARIEAKRLASALLLGQQQSLYCEVSAKDNRGVDKLFADVFSRLVASTAPADIHSSDAASPVTPFTRPPPAYRPPPPPTSPGRAKPTASPPTLLLPMTSDKSEVTKIVIVGNAGAGRAALAARFTEDRYFTATPSALHTLPPPSPLPLSSSVPVPPLSLPPQPRHSPPVPSSRAVINGDIVYSKETPSLGRVSVVVNKVAPLPVATRHAAAVVVVFDLSATQQLTSVRLWHSKLASAAIQRLPHHQLVICGNKLDLLERNTVGSGTKAAADGMRRDIKAFALSIGASYHETCAKDGRGVMELFTSILSPSETTTAATAAAAKQEEDNSCVNKVATSVPRKAPELRQRVHASLLLFAHADSLSSGLPNSRVSCLTFTHLAIAESLLTTFTSASSSSPSPSSSSPLPHSAICKRMAEKLVACSQDADSRRGTNSSSKPLTDQLSMVKADGLGWAKQTFDPTASDCQQAAARTVAIGLRFSHPKQLRDLVALAIEAVRITTHRPAAYLSGVAVAAFVSWALQRIDPKDWGWKLLEEAIPLAKQHITESGRDVGANLFLFSEFLGPWERHLRLRHCESSGSSADGPLFPVLWGQTHQMREAGFPTELAACLVAYDAVLFACGTSDWQLLCRVCSETLPCAAPIAAAWWGALFGFEGGVTAAVKPEMSDRIDKLASQLLDAVASSSSASSATMTSSTMTSLPPRTAEIVLHQQQQEEQEQEFDLGGSA